MLRRASLYQQPGNSYKQACRVMEQVSAGPQTRAKLQQSPDCPALLATTYSFVDNEHYSLSRYALLMLQALRYVACLQVTYLVPLQF